MIIPIAIVLVLKCHFIFGIDEGTNRRNDFARIDETVEEKSSGKSVVDAVLMKIKLSKIFFPDHEMMDRIAWTESQYGLDTETYRDNYHGGIWQIDKSVFEELLQNIKDDKSDLSKKKMEMIDKFDINWENVRYEDLEKPFYSGIAARLVLWKKEKSIPIPELLTEQGSYYENLYNPNGTNKRRTAEKYLKDSEELQKSRCLNSPSDFEIVFVLDGSGSVGWIDFKSAKATIASMASKFSLETSRIGFVVYSSVATEVISLSKSFSTKESLKESIMKADYPGAGTFTNLGIDLASEMLIRNNTAIKDLKVPKIIVVYTDGLSSYPEQTKLSADAAKKKSIILFSVGIGKKINHTELNNIGGGGLGNGQRSFETESFQSLREKTCLITKAVQEVPKEPPLNFTVEEIVHRGEFQNYAYEIPTEGIIVTIDNMNGKVEAYYSYTVATPNDAFYDGKIDRPTLVKKGVPKRHKRSSAMTETDHPAHRARNLGDSVYVSVYGVQNVSKYAITAERAFNSASCLKIHFQTLIFLLLMGTALTVV